jgi:alkanesulfonate monooxygenase SsuD/methylene tetrahydromethanopterin reductase-like flavin-dependent oxidoreductase (luciferase family)
MLHTFVGRDGDAVRRQVWKPFREYLRSAVSLERLAAEGGGAISGGHKVEAHEIPPATLEELLDLTVERYLREGSLIGTPQSLEALIWRLKELGVDEIACLIDFVADSDAVRDGLVHLAELRDAFAHEKLDAAANTALAQFREELD